MVNEQRLVSLFKDLCSINSPARHERDCADYLKKTLSEMGLEVFEDNAGEVIGGNSGNVIATLKGTDSNAPRIFLSAHMDTVEPTIGLEIVEEDGVLKSAGDTILGADDKGGVAPIVEAIRCLQESGESYGDVVLLLSIAEEIGLLGAENLNIEDLNLDFGYVLDTGPPVGTFVTKTAFHDKLDVTVRGVPAHSGKDPEHGINEIKVAAAALNKMKLGRIGPETTANFGLIEGGAGVNDVCRFVNLKGECRSTSEEELDTQVDHMIQCFESAASEFGTSIEVTRKRHYAAYHIHPDEPVVQVAVAASKKLGFEPTLRTTLGGSDANKFNVKGVPCIVVATGMEKIHTHEERISIADLVATTQLTIEIVLEATRNSR